jgi:hypothetical protein
LITTPFARATACEIGTGPAPISKSGSDGSMLSRFCVSGGEYGIWLGYAKFIVLFFFL